MVPRPSAPGPEGTRGEPERVWDFSQRRLRFWSLPPPNAERHQRSGGRPRSSEDQIGGWHVHAAGSPAVLFLSRISVRHFTGERVHTRVLLCRFVFHVVFEPFLDGHDRPAN
jgi:hypothetical protein